MYYLFNIIILLLQLFYLKFKFMWLLKHCTLHNVIFEMVYVLIYIHL